MTVIGVPDSCAAVAACGGDPGSVRAEGHCVHQLPQLAAAAQVSRRACAPDRRAARGPKTGPVGRPNDQPLIQLPLRQAGNYESRRMERASMDQSTSSLPTISADDRIAAARQLRADTPVLRDILAERHPHRGIL
jgi:hypothetical protein